MKEIEAEWSKLKPPPPKPDESPDFGFGFRKALHLMETKLSKRDIAELVGSLSTMPCEHEKQSEFQSHMIASLAVILSDRGDREKLVSLLSVQYRDYMGFQHTGAVISSSGKITEPVLVEYDAYQESKNPTIRKRIVKSFHESYDDVGVKGKDDDEFMKNAVKWYQEHKNDPDQPIYDE